MQELNKVKTFYALMALAALCILALPVGIANIVFGYILGDNPCILCWAQRISMIYIGVMALFIIRYGLKPQYLASILIMSAFGLYQSFVQVGAHAHRDLDQGFSLQIFGLHAYFWAFVVFWFVIVFLAVVLCKAPRFSHFDSELGGRSFRDVSKGILAVFYVAVIVVGSNAFQAFVSTGIPPFMGQSDPIRFSLNPRYIIWDDSELKSSFSSFSVLGARDVKAPDYAFAPSKTINFSHTAQAGKSLEITSTLSIDYKKALNSLAWINGEYVGTSKWDVVFMDDEFAITKSLEIDPYYSATIDPLVGIAKLPNDAYVAMGSNKTFLKFAKASSANSADERLEFANFISGYDSFVASSDGLGRGRASTVRAKFSHIGSVASDDEYLYTATVPSDNDSKGFVISGFLLDDMTLSFEFELRYDGAYITSMHAADGKLYALSKNHNTILVIDPSSHKILSTISYPSTITNARALMVRENEFWILSYQDGKNKVYKLN